MAHAVQATQKVSSDLTARRVDADGLEDGNGAIRCGIVDITSYPTNGETLLARELGLEEIDGIQLQEAEGELHKFSSVIAGDRKSVVVTAIVASTAAEASNATDLGKLTFVAWGSRAQATQNLSA